MPIDQARGNRAAARINDTVGIALFEANNYAVFNQQAIAVGNGLIQITVNKRPILWIKVRPASGASLGASAIGLSLKLRPHRHRCAISQHVFLLVYKHYSVGCQLLCPKNQRD